MIKGKDRKPSHGHAGLVEALVLLAIVIVVRAPSIWTTVIDPDEWIFALAAREVARGHLPYLTFFDIKPVGSTFLIAAAFKAFGSNIAALRIASVISVWATAVLLTRLGQRAAWDRAHAFGIGLLYIAFSTTLHGLATMTELLLAPFTAAAVLLLCRLPTCASRLGTLRTCALAGLACGIAVLIKLVPIVPAGLVLLFVLGRELLSRRLSFVDFILAGATFGIGSALPMALTALIYQAAGHLPEFVYANFGFSSTYVADRMAARTIVRELLRIVSDIWPLAALSALALVVTVRDLVQRRPVSWLTGLCAAWLAGEVAAASATLHFYHHYFLMTLPPLCILAMQGIQVLHRWLGAPARAGLALAVALALAPVAPLLLRTIPSMFGRPDLSHRAAKVITDASAGRKPTLFVTTQEFVGLYVLTNADVPSPYAQPGQFIGEQASLVPTDVKVELKRVLDNRPEFIVLNRDTPLLPWVSAQVEPALARDYEAYRRLSDFFVYDIGITRRHELYIYKLRSTSPVRP